MQFKLSDYNVYRYYMCAGLMLALGLTLVRGGPVEELPFTAAAFYWLLHVFVALLVYVLATRIITGFLPFSKAKAMVISAIGGALIFGLVAIFLEVPFFETPISFVSVAEEIFPASTQSFVFWLVINLPLLLEPEPKTDQVRAGEKSRTELQNLIFRRGENPIYIRSEANYLRIYFKERNDLVLYRLKDAVNELSFGAQVHRSYWVNLSEKVERIYSDKVPYLRLNNGVKVPIGRKFFPKIKHLESGENRRLKVKVEAEMCT